MSYNEPPPSLGALPEPDQALRVIVGLLELLIQKHTSAEFVFAAATHQYHFYEQAQLYRMKPEQALLFGSTASLLEQALVLYDAEPHETSFLGWEELPNIRKLLVREQ